MLIKDYSTCMIFKKIWLGRLDNRFSICKLLDSQANQLQSQLIYFDLILFNDSLNGEKF